MKFWHFHQNRVLKRNIFNFSRDFASNSVTNRHFIFSKKAFALHGCAKLVIKRKKARKAGTYFLKKKISKFLFLTPKSCILLMFLRFEVKILTFFEFLKTGMGRNPFTGEPCKIKVHSIINFFSKPSKYEIATRFSTFVPQFQQFSSFGFVSSYFFQ